MVNNRLKPHLAHSAVPAIHRKKFNTATWWKCLWMTKGQYSPAPQVLPAIHSLC